MRFSVGTLKTFIAVAEMGSITEAGDKLGRTPSTISMTLKALGVAHKSELGAVRLSLKNAEDVRDEDDVLARGDAELGVRVEDLGVFGGDRSVGHQRDGSAGAFTAEELVKEYQTYFRPTQYNKNWIND